MKPFLIALPLAALVSVTPAAAQTFSAEYVVTIWGITIARTNFSSTIDKNGYRVDGKIQSSGLGAVFDDTKGTVHTQGAFRSGSAVPATYGLDYSSGKKKQKTTVRMEGGNVVSTQNDPPPKRRHGWIPVEAKDLVGVVDPLTATMVQAKSLDDVCTKKARIYDGEMRADLQLSYLKKGTAKVGDFSGEGVTCKVSFKPVSGYRKGSKSIEYLAAGNDMRVTFARMGETDFYVPLRGQVETRIGTVHFRVGKMGV